MNSDNTFLQSSIKLFTYYRGLGVKAINQINDEDLFYKLNNESNSIAVIVNHLHGNMISRWTDFMTTDGEKEWRKRDTEFDDIIQNREELLIKWNLGWECLMNALNELTQDDMNKIIYIRNEGHTVTDAINRQVAHYSYHIGQIVFLSKYFSNTNWQTLSIARNNSENYNSQKFGKEKEKKHFTDDV